MFKKLSCFLLIITILFSVASCAKKADTAPLSEQSTAVSVSEESTESGEVTTTKPAKKEKDNKEQKKTTKKGEKKGEKSSASTTAKGDGAKKNAKNLT